MSNLGNQQLGDIILGLGEQDDNPFAFGQAQARILQVYFGHAQANCLIKQVYFAHAQAQADIKQVYQGYGQARAWILQTYQGYAQAQGTILQTYQSYGQAQGYISGGPSSSFGQAQADIKQIYFGFGQSQADILQVYQGYAQAEAWIKATYFAHAQAQTYITGIVQGFGQAQARILQTYNACGNAQGYITNSIKNHGQAQAVIKTIHFDAASELIQTATFNTTNFTHTPVGIPRAIVLAVASNSGTYLISSITYGGVAMSLATRGADVASEAGTTEIWFLGSNIPTGAQSVVITMTTTTVADYQFVAMSFLAGGDTEIVYADATGGDRTDPYLVAVNFNRISQGVISTYSGQDAPSSISEQTGWTLVHDNDFGTASGEVARQNLPSNQNEFMGFTIALEDNAFAAITFSEIIPHPQVFAQALAIIAPTRRSGNAQAFIRTFTTVRAQAQALITPTIGVNVTGQAKALILGQDGYANAQAYILGVLQVSGQAQARIAGQQHGQANALIANAGTSRYYNVVQGDIPTAYYRFTETVVAADTGVMWQDSAGDYDLSKTNASRGPISVADGILNTTETKGIDNKTTDTTPYNGNTAIYSGTSPITSKYNWALELWIKPTQTTTGTVSNNILSVGGVYDSVSLGTAIAGAINIYRASDGRISAGYYAVSNGSGGSLSSSASYNPIIPTTEFTHVVLTRGTGNISLYVNGVVVDAVAAANMIDPTNDVTINGNQSTNITIRYHLDEVAIYAHELLPEDILEHLRIGSGKNVWYGQAQAQIINTIPNGQAQAKINAFGVSKFGLARAKIHRYQGYGIALARIKLEAHNTTNAYQSMVLADGPVAAYYSLNDNLVSDITSSGASVVDTDYENKALDLIGSYDLTRLFSGTLRGPQFGQTGIPFLEGEDTAVINRDSNTRPTTNNGLQRNTDPFAVVEPIALTGPAINWTLELWFKLENNNGSIADIDLLRFGEQNFTAGYVGLKYSNTTSRIFAELRTGSLNTMGLSGPLNAPQVWHHIVLTRGTGNTKLYIDGILADESFINLHNFVRDTNLGLTTSGDNSQYYFDEFVIYSHELDSATVGRHYLVGMNKGTGYGQAAALIYAYRPVAQAQGSIQRDGYGFGNAKAHISIGGTGKGQAQAKIIIKHFELAQAQAFIADPNVFIGPYGNAQAIIGYEVFSDTFTGRVISNIGYFGEPSAIGVPDVGFYDTLNTGTRDHLATPSSIDGAELITNLTVDYQDTQLTPLLIMHDGIYSIEFRLSPVSTTYAFVTLVTASWNLTQTPSIYAYVYDDGEDPQLAVVWQKNTAPYFQLDAISVPALEDDTQYVLKFAVFGQNASVKIWKKSEVEPDWMLTSTGTNFSELWEQKGYTYAFTEYEVEAMTPPVYEYLDNYNIFSTDWFPLNQGRGLAVASIKNGNRGLGQAAALIDRRQRHGQAQARIVVYDIPKCANARATIAYKGWANGQAQASIIRRGQVGQAQAAIQKDGFGFGNALGMITIGITRRGFGQARARIRVYANFIVAQANASIKHLRYNSCGQALALIKGNQVSGQANAWIAYGRNNRTGQAMARIDNKTRWAQAQALILAVIGPGGGGGPGPGGGGGSIIVPAQSYLVEYNGYTLPGFAQSEALESGMLMKTHVAAMVDGSLVEYMGLENKLASLEMRVWDGDYIQVKKQVQKAGVILRSKRDDYAKLRLHYADRYYLAHVKKVSTDKEAQSSNFIMDYDVQFECKPWLYSEALHEISGTGTITTDQVSRTIDNGGWSPVTLEVSGSNITISGYTASESYTGYITISGAVSSLEIDTEFYSVISAGQNMNDRINRDYELFVGPDKTYFDISGASSCIIRYRDRWYL